jgi:hypothetical protein
MLLGAGGVALSGVSCGSLTVELLAGWLNDARVTVCAGCVPPLIFEVDGGCAAALATFGAGGGGAARSGSLSLGMRTDDSPENATAARVVGEALEAGEALVAGVAAARGAVQVFPLAIAATAGWGAVALCIAGSGSP